MAISNLISKIKENAHEEVKAILDKASIEEKEIIKKHVADANREKEIILEKAQREAKSTSDRIISGAELKARNAKLLAKQDMIQKVFDAVLVKLQNLSSEELTEFIRKSVLEAPFEGEIQLVLSDTYQQKVQQSFIDEMNAQLAQLGKAASIKFGIESRKLDSDFILSQNGIEINYTFKALVASLKEEMEFEVNKILFQ